MSRFLRRDAASSSSGTGTPVGEDGDVATPGTTPSARTSGDTTRGGKATPSKEGASSTTTPHPILRPHPSCKIPAPEVLTQEQQQLVTSLRAHMDKLIRSHYYQEDGTPRADGSRDEDGELVEPYYEKWEHRWLNIEGDETTVKRYLRAGKGNEADAIKRLESTLHWRRSFKPDIIPPEEIRIEGETGKHVLCGFDNASRPILYLIPRRENTKSSERQIRYVVWGLERTLDLLPPGQTKVTLAIDFYGSSQSSNPNMATSRRVLSILQNHYVERLGSALIIRPPWWMNAFYTAITPFVDPVTKEKVKWNTDLRGFVPPQHLIKEYGGEYDFEWDKEVTWNDYLDFTGVAPDGTRLHESYARQGVDEQETNGLANGEHDEADAASISSSDSKPQFHDAKEVISRASETGVGSV